MQQLSLAKTTGTTTSMKKIWKKALRKTFGMKAGITSYILGR